MNSFQAHLKEVWFTLYPRSNNWSKAIDSSGFEHIFLGESKGKQQSIGGLHNWIGAYLLEQKGTLDYTGYISYTKLSQGRYVYAARLRAYNNYWKSPFSSFIFGSSPEFDLAAYTVCFAMRPNKECSFKLQNKQLALQTYRFLEANYISSAYPVVSY